jgi:hypothetical protein
MPNFNDDIFLGSAQTYMGTGVNSATATISGTISGTTLTVVANLSGDILQNGQYITGASVTANSYVVASLGLNSSGQDQYTLSQSSTVGSATTMYAAGNALLGDPSPMSLGVGPLGRLYVWDTIPQTLQAANIAASQTPASAGNLTLTAGTSAISVVKSNGLTVIQLDVPRCVSVTQVTAGTNVTVTITGYDYYGQPMTNSLTSSTGATVNSLKAFYQISNIAVSAGTTTAVTVGTADILGLPVRAIDAGYVISAGWNNILARDTGTLVNAVTATATTALGDVRGTYALSSASNGSKRLVMAIALPAIAVGPNATRIGALGVTQA